MGIPQQATSASRAKKHFREAKLLGSLEGERHNPIRDYARHRRDVWDTVFKLRKKATKRDYAVLGGGFTKRWYVLSGISISGRKAIRDGLKLEIRQAIEGVGTPGFEEAFVVVLSVDKGYVEASVMEELGELKHGANVALSWIWYAHSMRPSA